MLPFQGEREESYGLGGFGVESTIMALIPRGIIGKMGFRGGSKRAVFGGTPKIDRLAGSPKSLFSSLFRSQTRLRFCRKKVSKLFPVTVIFYSPPPTGPVCRGGKC